MSDTEQEPLSPKQEQAPEGGQEQPHGWVPDEDPIDADDPQAQHPRAPDAESGENAPDSVERDHTDDSPEGQNPVKEGVGDEGWAGQSGALEEKGALGQE